MGNGTRPVIKKRFPWGWVVLLALAVLAGAGGYLQKHAPIALTVTAPARFRAGERDPLVTASGYVVARHRATLSAKVPGRVSWLGVEEGTRVRQGQVIARLENPDLQALCAQDRSALAEATRELKRSEALAGAGVLDQASLDKARSAQEQARAQLDYQQALLENMVLRAPFTGTVTQKLSELGETVSPGTAGGANAINAVATLVDFTSLEVEVEVNETGIIKLTPGMPVGNPGGRAGVRSGDPGAQGPSARDLPHLQPAEGGGDRAGQLPGAEPPPPARHGRQGHLPGRTLPRGRDRIGPGTGDRRAGATCVWVLEGGRAALQPVTIEAESPVGLRCARPAPGRQAAGAAAGHPAGAGRAIRVKER